MSSKSIIARHHFGLAVFLIIGLPTAQAWAQTGTGAPVPPKPLTIDDYSRWRRIEDVRISGNGQWVAYTLRHTNTLPDEAKPELRIRDLETGQDIVVPNAHDGEFSADSRWIVYQIDSIPAPRKNGGDNDSTDADSSATPQDSTRQTTTPPRVLWGLGEVAPRPTHLTAA